MTWVVVVVWKSIDPSSYVCDTRGEVDACVLTALGMSQVVSITVSIR